MGLRGATPNKSTHGKIARFRAASSLISEGVGGMRSLLRISIYCAQDRSLPRRRPYSFVTQSSIL